MVCVSSIVLPCDENNPQGGSYSLRFPCHVLTAAAAVGRGRSGEDEVDRMDIDNVAGGAAAVGIALNITPERIEYVTESEVEESELDQTAHNLSASLLDVGVAGETDSEE